MDLLRFTLKKSVTGRPSKSTTAIVEKLLRQKTRLSQMQDIAGCRTVVPDIPHQDRLIQAIETFLPRSRTVDRRKSPSHGYRAVHVVTVAVDRAVEIQVRTMLQHYWAEISEKLADTDPGLKYGSGDPSTQTFLLQLSRSIADLERVEAARADALRRISRIKGSISKPLRKVLNQAEGAYERERRRIVRMMKGVREQICELEMHHVVPD